MIATLRRTVKEAFIRSHALETNALKAFAMLWRNLGSHAVATLQGSAGNCARPSTGSPIQIVAPAPLIRP